MVVSWQILRCGIDFSSVDAGEQGGYRSRVRVGAERRWRLMRVGMCSVNFGRIIGIVVEEHSVPAHFIRVEEIPGDVEIVEFDREEE